MDGLVVPLAPKLLAACVDTLEDWLTSLLRASGFEFVEVDCAEARNLGVDLVALGNDRVLSMRGSRQLSERMRPWGSRSMIRTCRCSRWAVAASPACARRSTAGMRGPGAAQSPCRVGADQIAVDIRLLSTSGILRRGSSTEPVPAGRTPGDAAGTVSGAAKPSLISSRNPSRTNAAFSSAHCLTNSPGSAFWTTRANDMADTWSVVRLTLASRAAASE